MPCELWGPGPTISCASQLTLRSLSFCSAMLLCRQASKGNTATCNRARERRRSKAFWARARRCRRCSPRFAKSRRRTPRCSCLAKAGPAKEMAAAAIHRRSLRKDGPFIAINCNAIPENLLESELFGHEKGSFTGAHTQRKGLIESAAKGTLFLDEIGDLPLAIQVKLLRFLQEQTFMRVGGRQEIQVRRAHHRRDECRPEACHRQREVSRRFVLSPGRRRHRFAAAARAGRRYCYRGDEFLNRFAAQSGKPELNLRAGNASRREPISIGPGISASSKTAFSGR